MLRWIGTSWDIFKQGLRHWFNLGDNRTRLETLRQVGTHWDTMEQVTKFVSLPGWFRVLQDGGVQPDLVVTDKELRSRQRRSHHIVIQPADVARAWVLVAALQRGDTNLTEHNLAQLLTTLNTGSNTNTENWPAWRCQGRNQRASSSLATPLFRTNKC